MMRGKPLVCPVISLMTSHSPGFASRYDAWHAVLPVIARILAKIIRESAQFKQSRVIRPRQRDIFNDRSEY